MATEDPIKRLKDSLNDPDTPWLREFYLLGMAICSLGDRLECIENELMIEKSST